MFRSGDIPSTRFSRDLQVGTAAFLFLLVPIAAHAQSGSTPSATPPFYPGPYHESASPKPLPNCSAAVEGYSANRGQYAKFQLCLGASDTSIAIGVLVTAAQYWWGSKWYDNGYPITLDCTIELATPGQTISTYFQASGQGITSMLYTVVPVTRSGAYTVKPVASAGGKTCQLSGMYWPDAANAIGRHGDQGRGGVMGRRRPTRYIL
jgi:hypothetical protein